MVRAGILNSPSLVSIKLGNNIITPDEAMSLLQVFVAKPKNPLNFMHLQNVFVNKDFIPVHYLSKPTAKFCKTSRF